MSGKKIDWYKKLSGRTEEEDFRFPSVDESFEQAWKGAGSKYPLRLLGTGQEDLTISEEERESHMHIIGTTGEGKSKFLEYLIREDIDRGNGLCFFDPSENGDTLYKILSYCERKAHQKVLLIDPHHKDRFQKIAPINPFILNRRESKQKGTPVYMHREEAIANIMDMIRVLFKQKDASETPIIQRYLPAILYVLHNAGMTLADTVYFTDPVYVNQRDQILVGNSRQVLMLDSVFGNRQLFMEFQSTVRRLEPLFHPTLQLMFGASKGIDFPSLIADGWVILVNLYPGFGFEPIHTRLLGTAIINEIVSSLDRLKVNGWKGVYYLYIDEAGRYANRNLADLLAYKRKSGLRVTLSHQWFDQFDIPEALKAVNNACKIKVFFNVPDPDDRLKSVRLLGYGGELSDRDVSYTLSMLRRQHAVIRLPKQPPAIVRIPDVKDLPPVSEDYLNFIYSNPVYLSPDDIEQETKNRIRVVTYQTKSNSTQEQRDLRNDPSRASNSSSKKRATSNKGSTRKDSPPAGETGSEAWKGAFRSIRKDEKPDTENG